jgi:hypothetical protein
VSLADHAVARHAMRVARASTTGSTLQAYNAGRIDQRRSTWLRSPVAVDATKVRRAMAWHSARDVRYGPGWRDARAKATTDLSEQSPQFMA